MLSGSVLLNLDEQLINSIESERERYGGTINEVITNILEQYFDEYQEKQSLYDAWFVAEVERGVKSAREEPLVDHRDVVRQVRSIIAEAREKNAAEVV